MESSKLTSTMHVFPDWINRLFEDAKWEASQMQVKLLQNEGRRTVWGMCAWFGCETCGVPGLACRLLEQYLFTVLHGYLDDGDEREFRRRLQDQIPVLIACCIILASKMNNSASTVVAKAVHIVFMCKRIPCTLPEIVATEIKIYSALGFRIPLWTNVESGEMLAVEVGIPVNSLDVVARLVDLAEYRRHNINKNVLRLAKALHEQTETNGCVLSLHLTAGAVAAAARLLRAAPEAVPRLAALTRASDTYIKCIRNIICLEIVPQRPIHNIAIKRKGRT